MEIPEIQQLSPWDAPTPCPSSTSGRWTFRGTRRTGAFRIRQGGREIAFCNEGVGIAFGVPSHRVGLTRLRFFPTRTDFISVGGALWEIHVRRANGRVVSVSNRDSPAGLLSHVGDSEINAFARWPSVTFPEVSGKIAVIAWLEMDAESDAIRLRLSIRNHLADATLSRVDFPVISGFGYAGESDLCYSSLNHGKLHRGFAQRVQREYPSGSWSMQYVSLTCGDATLYLACEDPLSSYKGFIAEPGGDFRFYVHPPNPGADYEQDFDIVLEPMRGDWFDAAERYREWALKQRWAARGSVARRRDTPPEFKKIGLWMLESGGPDEVVPNVLRAREFFDAPLGVHWYNWHEIPFDHEYPHYFPTKPGFAEGVKTLRDAGITVMPYINGRLWDNTLDDFADARPFACKDSDGKPYTEIYGSSAPLSPMCPTQEFWHETVERVVRRLKDEEGVNALYIDQIASAGPRLCFDENHGHPLGGGHWWADGYYEMMRRIRAITGKDVALTTENNCEAFAQWFDAFLIWTERVPEMCPVYPAVYGDRILRFGSPAVPQDDETAFAAKVGRDFLWGAQLGWMGSWLLEPDHAPKAEFLRRLARFKAMPAARKYLTFGAMSRAPRWVEAPPKVSCRWYKGGDKAVNVTMDALERAAWRTPNGSTAVIVVNFDTQPHRAVMDLQKIIRPATDDETVVVHEITTTSRGERRVAPNRRYARTAELEVPPRDVAMLTWEFHQRSS